jgi:2-keto-3-deoxy-L-rhamnonate aldolase RhmA
LNKYETQMVEILSNLKANYGVLSVKAEFEAEGTRMDELLRLVDIARSAQLQITVKIGGCEAIRDLLEAKQIGVQNIVAPMVESAYAASKFVSAKNLVYTPEEMKGVKFLTNLETQLSLDNIDSIIDSVNIDGGLNGLVFGRVDFVGSRGLDRSEVNSREIEKAVSFVARKLKDANLELVVGGAVSKESLGFLRNISDVHLSRFETRKVIFSAESLRVADIEKGLLHAVHFELLWLLNKKEYYGHIHREDDKRIEMLESRWNILKNAKS